MRKKWKFIAPLAILAVLLFIAIGGLIVQQLWNWLLPGLFGWPALTFWEALGILVLCRILFGHHGLHGSGMRRRMADRMAERWADMTPEERERFRQGLRSRCGFGPPAGSETKGSEEAIR